MKNLQDPRHNARRLALQALFKWSYSPSEDVLQSLETVLEELQDTQEFSHQYDVNLSRKLLAGTVAHVGQLDRIISQAAPEWPIKQIARVDLAILRLAIYEVLHHSTTPPKVAIDEAVELAKEFGGENSPAFVNGVLGTIMKLRDKQPQK